MLALGTSAPSKDQTSLATMIAAQLAEQLSHGVGPHRHAALFARHAGAGTRMAAEMASQLLGRTESTVLCAIRQVVEVFVRSCEVQADSMGR